MNILLAAPFEMDLRGGVTIVVHNLGRQLCQRGDHIAYLEAKHGRAVEELTLDENRLYRVPMRPRKVEARPWRSRVAFLVFFPLTCWRLAKILRKEGVQVINAHYFADFCIYFLFLRHFLRFRFVVSIHGSDVLGPEGARNLRLMKRWRRSIDCVVFCSEGFRQQVLSKAPWLSGKSAVVLNGLDCDELPPPRNTKPGRKYITCVAHLRQHKGQDVLIRSFHLLGGQFLAFELDLVGDGPFRGELDKLIIELGLSERVQLHGDIPRRGALELMRNSHVMCLPSRREPFGLVLLEAMVLHTPVVATRVGGVPEIIRDGVDGLLVEPDRPEELAKALERVLVDEELRARLVENGAQRVRQRFTVARFARDYRSLLLDILAEPNHR